MKVQLDDGTIHQFPENANSSVIADAIKRHLGKKDEEAKQRMVVQDEETRKQKEAEKKADDEKKKREATDKSRHQDHLKMAQDQMQMTVKHHADNQQLGKTQLQMHAAMASGIEELGKTLADMKGLPQKLDKLTSCIDDLANKIEQASQAIVKTMKTPRKIIHDEKKRPIGMKMEDE